MNITGIVQGLTPNTKYGIYVIPYNGGFAGPKSNVVTIITPEEGRFF